MALDGWASRFCASRGAKTQESFVDFKFLQRRIAQNKPSRRRELFNQRFPKYAEQVEIVRRLDAFFDRESQAKAQAEAALEAIDTMKKSILASAFRGELGTNDPAEESAVELLKQSLEADA